MILGGPAHMTRGFAFGMRRISKRHMQEIDQVVWVHWVGSCPVLLIAHGPLTALALFLTWRSAVFTLMPHTFLLCPCTLCCAICTCSPRVHGAFCVSLSTVTCLMVFVVCLEIFMLFPCI